MSLSAQLASKKAAKKAAMEAKATKAVQSAMKDPWRRAFNQATGAKLFHTVLAMNMVDETTQEDIDALHGAALAQLHRLTTGVLDLDGFIELNEYNLAAFHLAALMFQNGTDDTKVALAPTQKAFEEAADALGDIGARHTGKRFVAKANELNDLRYSFELFEQLIAVAPRGYVCRALQNAAIDVKKKLDELAIQCNRA